MTALTLTATPKSTPSARFWDKIAAKYARTPIADEAAYQRKLKMTQAYLRPDMTVFEFGCGTGSTALVHAPHVAHIRATDLSGAMINIARDKAKAAGISNVTFEQASIETVEASEGGYDAILGMSILHLVADRRGAIARAHEMLKPGGIFVTSTICLTSAMPWVAPVLWGGRALGFFPPVSMFTKAQLESEIRDAGFEMLERWQPKRTAARFLIAKKVD